MSKWLLIIKAFVNSLRMRVIHQILVIALITGLVACQSATQKHAERQIVPESADQPLGAKLSKSLLRAHGQWQDERVELILNSILGKLIQVDPDYASVLADTRVVLLGASTPYVAPGITKRIYVSRGLLGAVRYENELAFLLATQLALLKEQAVARNLALLRGQDLGESLVTLPTAPPPVAEDFVEGDWFEPGGLFDFGDDVILKAEKEGIRLIYGAQYDPRGAVTLIQRWTSSTHQKHFRAMGRILPESSERLRQAREEVAKLSPVRDPIIKSAAFDELQNRLHIKKAKAKH